MFAEKSCWLWQCYLSFGWQVVMLNRTLGLGKWVALALLSGGVAIVQIAGQSPTVLPSRLSSSFQSCAYGVLAEQAPLPPPPLSSLLSPAKLRCGGTHVLFLH